jgi:hypothetical protein
MSGVQSSPKSPSCYLPHQLLDDPIEAHAAAVRSAISGIRR